MKKLLNEKILNVLNEELRVNRSSLSKFMEEGITRGGKNIMRILRWKKVLCTLKEVNVIRV